MINQLRPLALALFIAGGLLSGTLGLYRLGGLTSVETASAPTPTPPPLAAVQATPGVVQPPAARPATSTPVARAALAATPTPPPQDLNRPAWLYVVDGNIWLTGDSAPLQLTTQGGLGQPALGDDGLVFVARARNASDVWLASSDGPPRQITHASGSTAALSHWASQPVFVPGRPRLYVVGDLNKATTGPGDLAVWEVGLDQTQPTQITSPPAYSGGDQDVSVDPDDPRQIIFTRYAYVGSQLVEQLQWLNVATRNLVALTDTDQAARQASYSPDGQEIAFVQHGAGGQEDLYVATLDASSGRAQLGSPRQVATGVIANPVWTPDGSELAYAALTPNGFQLWSVDIRRDASGAESFGTPRQLTNGAGVDATSRPIAVMRDQADEIRQWLATANP